MGERRVFEGKVVIEDRQFGPQTVWLEDSGGHGTCDFDWIGYQSERAESLEGKRVRITVEVLNDAQPTAGRAAEEGDGERE